MVRLRSSKETNSTETKLISSKKRKHIKIEVEEENTQDNKDQKIKNLKNIKIEKDNKIKRGKIVKAEDTVINKATTKKGDNCKNSKSKPKYWLDTLNEIKKYRMENEAPVDTQGCERLADEDLPPKQYRYQVLISLMLSSQTKDQTTAEAIHKLQKKGLTIENVLKMSEKEIDECIEKVGFHNRKTIYIKKTTEILHEKYDDDIPDNIEELIKLPGVGKKMGYLTLQVAWNKNMGIGVDVHVHRISERLGWIEKSKNPEIARVNLESWLPDKYWKEINPLLVGFGQICCLPVNPKCSECPVHHCPSRKKSKK
ncbi:DNA glycosylase [Piromyces finnis]|uniref:Endonuclease III homolog n=1 Tax=Piromyces finnis TaxID=1754191 RepID=A0A1Y1VL18_9FUNG|nr:DNA glycosylase [Piromyces finnis]|eukprot:ORX59160.1 DNA glycosylase [Piromyces finnis]